MYVQVTVYYKYIPTYVCKSKAMVTFLASALAAGNALASDLGYPVGMQARLWACGRGDMSTPSFGSQLNPIHRELVDGAAGQYTGPRWQQMI